MDGGCEASVTEDFIDVLLPETWGLWVSLHSTENRDNMTLWNRRTAKMFRPPFMKGTVRSDEESLFWWWCFAKGITDVSTVDNVVFDGGNSIK